ncbi:MAG: MBL fold metallo-hydrolase [Anaerolineae bacterium]|nr:MBL fold metallo-hydrolase [Anaerolineae bacterium]
MREVAPGVYVETAYGSGNVGAVLTGVGIVCVDMPMLPRDAHHWLAQLASVTDEPIIALIQTDYDRERVISTHVVDAPLIAHDATWSRMRVYSSEKVLGQINELLHKDSSAREWQVRMPDITFSDRLILVKGEREIHVLHGGGHSPAACMVSLPRESILFTGDIVTCGVHPSMTHAESREWLATLTALRKMSVGLIIPGHGRQCDKDATYALSDYVRELRAAVRRAYQAGRSKSETSSAVIARFVDAFEHDEADREHVRMLIKGGSDRIYDEYRAEAKSHSGKAGARRSSRRRRRKRV